MSKDQVLGAGILIGSLTGVAVYFFLVFFSVWDALTIKVSAFAAVAAVLLILAWIGYTLATTPPPAPIEDLTETLEETKTEETKEP